MLLLFGYPLLDALLWRNSPEQGHLVYIEALRYISALKHIIDDRISSQREWRIPWNPVSAFVDGVSENLDWGSGLDSLTLFA